MFDIVKYQILESNLHLAAAKYAEDPRGKFNGLTMKDALLHAAAEYGMFVKEMKTNDD